MRKTACIETRIFLYGTGIRSIIAKKKTLIAKADQRFGNLTCCQIKGWDLQIPKCAKVRGEQFPKSVSVRPAGGIKKGETLPPVGNHNKQNEHVLIIPYSHPVSRDTLEKLGKKKTLCWSPSSSRQDGDQQGNQYLCVWLSQLLHARPVYPLAPGFGFPAAQGVSRLAAAQGFTVTA